MQVPTRKTSGFILIISLIFIQLYTYLLLSVITQAKITTLTNYEAAHRTDQLSIQLIHQLLTTNWQHGSTCILTTSSPYPMLDDAWWLHHACHYSNQDYTYYYYFQILAHHDHGNYYRLNFKLTRSGDAAQLWQAIVNDRMQLDSQDGLGKLLHISSIN